MELATFSYYFAVVCIHLSIVPIAIGLWKWSYLSKDLRFFLLYLLFFLISNDFSIFLANSEIYNHFMGYVDSLVEVVFILGFFRLLFLKNPIQKRVSLSILACLAVLLIDVFWVAGLFKLNSFSSSVISLCIIIFALIFLKQSFQTTQLKKQEIEVYVCLGIVLMYIPTFIFNLSKEKLIESDATYRVFFQIANVMYFFKIIGLSFFTLSFWKTGK